MKITHSSELMKNQKHALIMAPDKEFKVLQTYKGHSLFFSIGTRSDGTGEAGVFYCTREVAEDRHGWVKMDFSTGLSKDHDNAVISAKCFDVGQDILTGTTDIALAVTVNGQDFLYLSLANTSADDTWTEGSVTFTQIPFDDSSRSFTMLNIAGVYIRRASDKEYIVVDVVTDSSSPVKTISRYFIDSTKEISGNCWNPHDVPVGFETGHISNYLGRISDDEVDGIYTMATIDQAPQLVYMPLYDPWDHTVTPPPTPVTLPAGTTAMALSFCNPPYSDLFVVAENKLYFLSADDITKEPQVVYTHPLLAEVQKMHVNNLVSDNKSTVTVWCLNKQEQVFYLRCNGGNETNTAAWSYPVPIHEGVQSIGSYINKQFGNTSLFVNAGGDKLLHLLQDVGSTHWSERSITLSPPDNKTFIQTYTYTTHITCADDCNLPVTDAVVTLTTTETCAVYINDIYHQLQPDDPLQVKPDVQGTITIVQSVDGIGGACFSLNDGTQNIPINTMTKVLGNLNNVQSGGDLAVDVKDENGKSEPLINKASVDKDQMAAYVKSFVAVHNDLPADGTRKSIAGAMVHTGRATDPADIQVFGIWFGNGGTHYFNGADEAQGVGLVLDANGMFTVNNGMYRAGEVNSFETAVGDLWRWLKSIFEEVEHFFIQVIEGINHFFVSIADAVYHFALVCINDILQGIQFVLNKIEVVLEKIVQWVGHIFAWDEVIAAHRVLRNVFEQFGNLCLDRLSNGYYSDNIKLYCNKLTGVIDEWAKIPAPLVSFSNTAPAHHTPAEKNSASSNWGIHHLKNNIASCKKTPDTDPFSITDDLVGLIEGVGDDISKLLGQLGDISDFKNMSLADLVKKILAAIADFAIDTVEAIFLAFLDAASKVLKGVMEMLKDPLDIPVISMLYSIFSGGEVLSMLDLVCLVAAIPVTYAYKLANHDKPPFPVADELTDKLSHAGDFQTIAQFCFERPAQSSVSISDTDHDMKPLATPVGVILMRAGNYAALFGGISMAVLGGIMAFEDDDPGKKNKWVAAANAACYIPYIGPDIMQCAADIVKGEAEGPWYDVFNDVCSGLGQLKALLNFLFCWKDVGDKQALTWSETISPGLDFFINLSWEAPTIGAFVASDKTDNDIAGLLGNTFFNLTGVMSPMIAWCKNPESKIVLVLTSGALNVAYGLISLGLAVDTVSTEANQV